MLPSQIVGADIPIHTKEFAQVMKAGQAHQALADGTRIIALHIAKIFCDPGKIRVMKADFDAG